MDEKNVKTTPAAVPADKPVNAAWANPTPAGLVALAVACFTFFALLTGRVTGAAMPLMGCFLLGGFAVQIIVALLDLKGNNTAGGNTFLYFSAFFMLASGMEMMFKYFYPGLDTRIDGWAWMALFFVVLLWTPAFFKGSGVLFILVLFLNVAVFFIFINDLDIGAFDGATKAFKYISGISLLICGILGIYLSGALVINATYGRTILPNPTFYKKK